MDDPDEVDSTSPPLQTLRPWASTRGRSRLRGVRDSDHQIIGTAFDPSTRKVGNEDQLVPWLLQGLSPRHKYRFEVGDVYGNRVVLASIEPAFQRPVQFKGEEYIRIGSYKKKAGTTRTARDGFGKNSMFARSRMGSRSMALLEMTAGEFLDLDRFFGLLGTPIPGSRTGILDTLESHGLVRRSPTGVWEISNLGALALAKDLEQFSHLSRKAPRIVRYKGTYTRIETIRERIGVRGYASEFQELLDFTMSLLPDREVIIDGIRRGQSLYPQL